MNLCGVLQLCRNIPSRQILLVAGLPESLVKQHDGAIVSSVPDAPSYCLVQCPEATNRVMLRLAGLLGTPLCMDVLQFGQAYLPHGQAE